MGEANGAILAIAVARDELHVFFADLPRHPNRLVFSGEGNEERRDLVHEHKCEVFLGEAVEVVAAFDEEVAQHQEFLFQVAAALNGGHEEAFQSLRQRYREPRNTHRSRDPLGNRSER